MCDNCKNLMSNNRMLLRVIESYEDYFRKECCHENSCRYSVPSSKIPRNKSKKNKDHHEFIPSSDKVNVINCLRLCWSLLEDSGALQRRGLKFIDAGCGVGNIMLFAQALGYSVHGIEYDTKTHRLASKFFPKHRLTKGDMLKFKRYHEFDVVYFYVPIKNNDLMGRFIDYLIKSMKVGAFIISYRGYNIGQIMSSGKFKTHKAKNSYDRVYEKIKQ